MTEPITLFNKYQWWRGTSYGVHAGYDVPDARQRYLDLQINTLLVLDADTNIVQWCYEHQINCIVRPYNLLEPRQGRDPNLWGLGVFVKWCIANGYPAYIQLGNEEPASDDYMTWWQGCAETVIDNGGHPGVGAVFNQDVGHFLWKLKERGKLHYLTDNGFWVTHHGYPYNHPWDYPHDAKNQAEWPGSNIHTVFDQANPRNRASYSLFGFLDTCYLIKKYLRELTGESIPIPVISGEALGGVDDEWYVDMRYPYPTRAFFMECTQKMIELFRQGKITLGDMTYKLPDTYLGCCDWIMGDYRPGPVWRNEGLYVANEDYYSSKLGQIVKCGRPEVVEYLTNLESFIRKFSWEGEQEEMDDYERIVSDIFNRANVVINPNDAFYKFIVKRLRETGELIFPLQSRDGFYYTQIRDWYVAYTQPMLWCRIDNPADVKIGLPPFA